MDNGEQMIKQNKILAFLRIVFVSAIIIGAFPAFMGWKWEGTTAMAVGVVYMAVPALAAIFVQKRLYHEEVIKPLKVSFKINRWFVIAWLLPVLLAFGAFAVSLIMPGVSFSPDLTGMFERYKDALTPEQIMQMKTSLEQMPVHPILITIVQGLLAGITVNAVAAFGEELGWRGFLLRELMPLGFARASLLIGAIWGIWHAPIILQGHNYPQHPVIGVFMMIVFCVLVTPLINWVTIRANSVIAAAIMHGSINGLAGIAIVMLQGGSDLTIGLTGLGGFIALACFDLVLFSRMKPAIWEESEISKV